MIDSQPDHPIVIQGGMGIGVSGWRLARAVSLMGQLGVVSGTALAHVLARRLEAGGAEPELERAMARFPIPGIVARVKARYRRRPRGRARFSTLPMYTLRTGRPLTELAILANFVEVFLAKEGHGGRVGLNLLEKVQLPNLPSLYGAMLAGVDYVLMGAGVPRAIPAVLDRLADHQHVALTVPVADPTGGGEAAGFTITFSPDEHWEGGARAPLRRPRFLPIVSSDVLATMLARRAPSGIDGFVVEGPAAGGHNAPPRGALRLDERGQPIYGERDRADLARMRSLGLPFWLAGAHATRERVVEARRLGAQGVQVGTAFALCRESGVSERLKRDLLERSAQGTASVRTDPRASPTGMPFKVARLGGSLSEDEIYAARERRCDVGYLRQPYRAANGEIGYRCPAESVSAYRAKEGDPRDTEQRRCLCNGLLATVGLGQRRGSGYEEPPLVTAGDDIATVARFVADGHGWYSASDVVRELLGGAPPASP
jgi:NAD(P)H-dependent flavin oxidoreductase YrpB (nitropropane dioxygenase family)